MQARCRDAATLIQAWWRGHAVRSSPDLAAARAAAAAEKEARRLELERRRNAAAVTIQVRPCSRDGTAYMRLPHGLTSCARSCCALLHVSLIALSAAAALRLTRTPLSLSLASRLHRRRATAATWCGGACELSEWRRGCRPAAAATVAAATVTWTA